MNAKEEFLIRLITWASLTLIVWLALELIDLAVSTEDIAWYVSLGIAALVAGGGIGWAAEEGLI